MTNAPRLGFACAVLTAALLLASPAASLAKTRSAWTTTKTMAKKIHGFVPQIPTANTSAPSQITASTCRGLGKAHKSRKGRKKKVIRKFTMFRCTATWEQGKKSRVWARSLPGGKFCASSTGLSACPAAAPAAGDPRICHDPPAASTSDPNRCARSAAEAAVLRAMQTSFADPGWQLGNLSCDGANLTWKCKFLKLNVFGTYYYSTIRFAPANGAWATTIATTGGATSTCTVQPDPTTAAGKPSTWSAGPTPTCA